MRDLRDVGIKNSHIYEYLKSWEWPNRLGSKTGCGVEAFCDDRSQNNWEAKTWKCTQSECLSLHAPLAQWFRTVLQPTGSNDPACDAIVRLSTMIHVLWHCAKLRTPPAVVKACVESFLQAFVKAWGNEAITWKFHALLHLHKFVERYGFAPNTICLERKHKRLIAWAENHASDSRFVLKDALSEWLHSIEDAPHLDFTLGLQAPRKPSKKMVSFLTESSGESNHLVSGNARFSAFEVAWTGDIVSMSSGSSWELGRVIFFAETSGTAYAAVQPFSCTKMSTWHSTWKKSGLPKLVDFLCFTEVLIHRGTDDEVEVFHPLSLAR